MLIVRGILAVLLQPAIFTLLLFGPAESFAWWRAWVLIGIVFAATAVSVAALLRDNQSLLEERLKPPMQRGQSRADRIAVLVFLAVFVGTIRFIPEDVFRLHLLRRPGPLVSTAGLGLVFAGWWIVVRSLRANAFAIPVVKHQKDRKQWVVDGGPYAIVRHPMYAGIALVLVGMPLWLESIAGALVALAPIATLLVRIAIEERFLRRELPGYERYTTRVQARLIPGVW